MTSADATLRALLAYALILPAAVIVGYFVGTPTDFTSLAIMALLMGILTFPLFLKWHFPLLILTWNMTALAFFLPGRPQLWILMAVVSLFISVSQRTLTRNKEFLHVPSVTAPLVFLIAVVIVTAYLRGGIGVASLGSEVVGGRRYILILVGVMGFFAMIGNRIPVEKAHLYIGLFFLGAVFNAIGSTASFVPQWLYPIFWMFPVTTNDLGSLNASVFRESIDRFQGLTLASEAVFCYVLARYGLRDTFERGRVLRVLLLIVAAALGSMGGFRSLFVTMTLILVITFFFEGLFRTKYAVLLVGVAILLGAFLVPFADKLPLSMQRTLSVLPLKLDPVARISAQGSSEWRIEMWKAVWPEVGNYFWLGRGLAIEAAELGMATDMERRGTATSQELAVLAGDYHNGPLSSIIPFGVWGAIGWIWFLIAAWRALHKNYHYGDPELKQINTFLLAYFTAKLIFFTTVFGNFYSDLPFFVGIVGFSFALNGGIRQPAVAPSAVQPLRQPRQVQDAIPA